MSPSRSAEHVRAVYAAHARAVLGYALRRADRPEDAADVVAETFLVMLRRVDDVPPEPQTRAWLYAVARKVLANQHRGRRRRVALAGRLRDDLTAALGHRAAVHADHADAVAADTDARRLLAQLPDRDREILELAAWEGMEPREIAEVLAMTPNAVRLRLSRARGTLRNSLGASADPVPKESR